MTLTAGTAHRAAGQAIQPRCFSSMLHDTGDLLPGKLLSWDAARQGQRRCVAICQLRTREGSART